MPTFLLGLGCSALGVIAWVLARAYRQIPAKELKRRSRSGDELATVLYRVAAYGVSVKLVLYALALLFVYLADVLFVKALGVWVALPTLLVSVLAGVALVYSHGGPRKTSIWLAAKLSPMIAWVLERGHPIFRHIERLIRRVLPIQVHTGVYRVSDLLELLHRQEAQVDNQIPKADLEMARRALSFSEKTVSSAMTPRRVVKAVNSSETVGPILMSELHGTGHSRFPVYEGQKDHIVGVLYLHDLVAAKHTGTVQGIMRAKVVYVHETFTLTQCLQAFLKTKQHLFVVVNEFEEYVGVITIEDVLEQAIGHAIVDEFDQYEDLRAVAAAAAHKEHKTVQHPDESS